MSSAVQPALSRSVADAVPQLAQWFAIHTRPRHEKKVIAELDRLGVSTLLPISRQVRRWSDRRKLVEFPLFPCYAFVQIIPSAEKRVSILRSYGVLGFVGPNHGTPIPAAQVDYIRTLMTHGIAAQPEPFVRVGQRVRVRGGALEGLEGIVVDNTVTRRLIISIETIQRSISVSLDGYDIERL
jgi:transcription antitermination factor NusG